MYFKLELRTIFFTLFVILITNTFTIAQFKVNAGKDTSICFGGSVKLSAVVTGGIPSYTYTWSPSYGLSSVSISNPIATPTVTTTYTVTVKDHSNSTVTDAVTITVNTVPTVIITPDSTSICLGNSVSLNASGANTYKWSNNAVTNTITVNPAITTVYTVTGTNSFGCTNTASAIVTVVLYPVASFTFSPNDSCSANAISFTSTSTGNNLTYLWNFGDPASGANNTSALANPTHLFTSAIGNAMQNFTVTLIVTSSNKCSKSVSHVVTVKQSPDPSLVDPITNFNNCASASSSNQSFTITVQNSSATNNVFYTIIWGDGTANYDSVAFSTIIHTYTTLGIFNLVFQVTGANGCIFSHTYQVKNISNPAISFGNPGNTQGCAPKTICFPITGYSNNDASTTYTIDFGDGTPFVNLVHPPPDSVCHTYTITSCNHNGNGCSNCFVATMTANNACDSTKVTTSNIKIYVKPKPVITSPIVGCVNQPLNFANTSIVGYNNLCDNSAVYTWNFGDGSPILVTSNTSAMNHIYSPAGTYIVTLGTQNYCGSDSTKDTVCINPLPFAKFAYNDSVFCRPDSVFFTNMSSASNLCGNATYTWNINCINDSCDNSSCGGYSYLDGTNLHSVNPVIYFSRPGKYLVNLTYANSCNPPGTYSKTIRVKSKPTALFNGVPANICQHDSIFPKIHTTACYSNISSYLWSFSGGSPSSSNSLIPGSVKYDTAGIYNISIQISNGCGDTTISQSITINPFPVLKQINNISVCSDSLIKIDTLSSTPYGAVFNWTNNNTLIGLTSSGIGNIPSWNAPPNNTGSNITGTITVTPNLNGCSGTPINFNVTILPSPNVVINSQSICIGQSATITASGANNYIWSNFATGNSITVSPTNTTTYSVTGTSLSNGCFSSDTATVTVIQTPKAIYNNDSIACLGTQTQFNNNSINAQTYFWNFGDGNTSTQQNPTHIYSSLGNYSIYLIATSNCGKDSLSSKIHVIQAPFANFTVSPIKGCAPLSVAIINQSGGSDINYLWNFGIPPTSNGNGPFTIVYPQGLKDTTYYITLTDSNACGSFSHSDSVLVYPKPVMNFGMSQNYGCSPATIQLVNYAGGVDTLIWNFGDGSPIQTITNYNNVTSHTFIYNGKNDTTFTITLVGINKCGNDTMRKKFTVYPNNIIAFFNIDTLSGCQPLTVHFTNFSSSGGTTYSWNFGDGNFSNLLNPSHTYTLAGQYAVMLAVTNGCSYDTFYSVPIKVYSVTVPYFSIKQDSVCSEDTIFFVNPPPGMVSYTWNFGDGSPLDYNTNPYHIYNVPGMYQVTLTIRNQHCQSSVSMPVYIKYKPSASFTSTPNSGCSPLSVQFNNTTDSLNSNTYFWNFNNGITSVSLFPSIQTFFNNSNCKDSMCKVVLYANNGGCIDSTFYNVTVYPKPLSNFITSDSTFCCFDPPKQIQFHQEAICAQGFQWYVDDTLVSSALNPAITFPKSEDYVVSLVVSNQHNCKDTTTVNYIVYSEWEDHVSITPAIGCEPFGVQFNATSDSLNYLWELGDNTVSTLQNVYHIYNNAGLYTVTVKAKGLSGCVDSLKYIDTITVLPIPKASFTYSYLQSSSINDGTILFDNTSTGAISYAWNFGDGAMYYGLDTTHRFLYDNNFDIVLIATNSVGCPDTFTEHISIDFLHGLFIPNAFSPSNLNPMIRNFQPIGVGLATYHIQIYDTWGNLVWESSKIDNEGRPSEYWDGKLMNGKNLPMDVYVWKAEAVFINGETWQGMDYGDGKPKTYGTITIIK